MAKAAKCFLDAANRVRIYWYRQEIYRTEFALYSGELTADEAIYITSELHSKIKRIKTNNNEPNQTQTKS